ncbi:MAG: hypothetical protein ISR69_13970 [Gammaproteobacteria bacterium]|nr:hypothetical protein [Gammaproteobacteria bacterium]
MEQLLDWVEAQAYENLKFRITCLENILKECNTTLTILLAGVGASAAYAFKMLDSGSAEMWLIAGIIGLCFYFLILSALLITKCIKIDEIQVPTNEPDNLYQPNFDIIKLREIELKNVQARINKAAARNLRVANWLNKIRMLILISPAAFLLASVFYLYSGLFSQVEAVVLLDHLLNLLT